ncbi:MAG TPA: hypothetical protein VLJ21_02435 [Candidatus Binatia bacterium]|nr:hypothetical protein [Candidatus Binatia bacterium]
MEVQYAYLAENWGKPVIPAAAMPVLEYHVEHPDPGSKFEGVVAKLAGLPTRRKMEVLMSKGFDCLLGIHEQLLVSFLAIQRDPPKIGLFKAHTEEAFRHNGYGVGTLAKLVQTEFADSRVEYICAGEGKNTRMTALLTSLKNRYESALALSVNLDTGFIYRA